MGKGAKPAYSWWDGQKLSYVEARKKIYIPLYSEAVVKTDAYDTLSTLRDEMPEIWLWDYDGYDHVKHGIQLKDVADKPDRKMGHAFVLAMLLEKLL
jgi:hypothetical protein